ncbi:glycosyltransferase [Bordetella genomosp. 13]|uniref:glycosyltransferase n=1 Tax=Bordetella genomosp. 13 TaxID=463040 RepID=UPI001642EA17|nr:glycosyltransferase [Bordetella genomosp. 13]
MENKGAASVARQVGVFLYRAARFVGKRLPLSHGVKSRAKARVLAVVSWLQRRNRHRKVLDVGKMVGGVEMRPEACGLVPGLVSVILPVYNQAYLITEAVDSVLAQTYQDFELIIVNDGSSDGVEQVLQPYLSNPRVRVYTQKNQRLPKALSNGFDLAQGEFWTWTSADNIMEPRMLEMLVERLRGDPTIGMTYADYYAIDDRGELLQDPAWRAHNRKNVASGEIELPRNTDMLNTVQDNFIGACFMYRGWIGRCFGDYDPQLGIEDYDYWMRINAFFPIRHLEKTAFLYRYRVHDNTLSAQAQEHRILEKVQRLMTYEGERAAFYRQPLSYLVDDESRRWLTRRGVAARQMQPLPQDGELPRGARLVVVAGIATVARSPHRFRDAGALVVLLNDERADYVRAHDALSTGALALAPDAASAARMRLLSRCPVLDISSGQALSGLQAYARNRLFFHATRQPDELARQRPQRLLPPAGQGVMLQVDDFVQGGLENVVIDLAISLRDLGHRVSIAVLGREGHAAQAARQAGLTLHSFGKRPSQQAYTELLRAQRVDVVNAHYSLFGADICAGLGIPFVQTVHNSYVWLGPDDVHAHLQADPDTDSYVCVSATAARYADLALGLDVTRIKVIPNGIDPRTIDRSHVAENRARLRQAWGIGDDVPVYLNVAAIMRPKAQLQLVRAFAAVVRQSPQARLLLLGRAVEEDYLAEIQAAIAENGLQQNVVLAGFDPDVASYYQAADCFVLPSFWEGWSLSLGEAVANGLPCVITDVGSAYEFYDHPNVEVVIPPFGDIVELNCTNLGAYLDARDPAFEQRLGEAMVRVLQRRGSGLDERFLERADRAVAYRRYAIHFADLVSRRQRSAERARAA